MDQFVSLKPFIALIGLLVSFSLQLLQLYGSYPYLSTYYWVGFFFPLSVIFTRFIYLCIYLFLNLFLAALGLRCGAWAYHCGGFSCCGARALGVWASVLVAQGLSCSVACGIFPDQGSNPCPLRWQADTRFIQFGFEGKLLKACT